MDASRQILRWSIPGWLFVFVFAMYWLIMLRFLGSAHFYNLIMNVPSPKIGVEGTLFLAAAGIPLGFIIYQIYYFMYGNVLLFFIVNIDRGKEVISSLPQEAVDRIEQETGITPRLEEMMDEVRMPLSRARLHLLRKGYRHREARRLYEQNIKINWEIIRYYLSLICVKTGTTVISKEFITLSDIYHSLGASRVSIFLSYISCVGYIILRALIDNSSLWAQNSTRTIGGLLAVTIVFLFLVSVFSRTRRKALTSSQSFLKHSYYAYFTGKLDKSLSVTSA